MVEKKEIWVDSDKGGFYEGLYEVSNFGRWKILPRIVNSSFGSRRHISKERITSGTNSHGYRTVMMKREGIKKQVGLHIMVAKWFVDNPNNHPHVLHKDDNRSNNYYENLEWGTPTENSRQMFERGRERIYKGEERTNAKLTGNKVREIRELYNSGEHTHRSLAKMFNVSYSHIEDIVKFKRWKHIS